MIKPEWVTVLCGVAIVATCFAISFAEGMNVSQASVLAEVATGR